MTEKNQEFLTIEEIVRLRELADKAAPTLMEVVNPETGERCFCWHPETGLLTKEQFNLLQL